MGKSVDKENRIPFFGLDRQYEIYQNELLALTDKVFRSGQVLQGKEVALLEKSLEQLCHRQHAVALGSCTDALAFALLAKGVGTGDVVMVTPFSFFASVSAILRVGARPCFVDIDPETYMMDLSNLESYPVENVKAIIAVHLFGQTLDMDPILAFAAKHNLIVVEDAAQALGAKDGDNVAGSFGDVSCLSFDPTKVIGSYGTAGALLTDDKSVAETVKKLRYHGRSSKTREYEMLGYNSQMATDKAAMLRFKLNYLTKWEVSRKNIAQHYLEKLQGLHGLTLPVTRNGSSHVWHKFVIRTNRRDQLKEHLVKDGIDTMIHYPRLLCDEPLIQNLQLPSEFLRVPQAQKVTDTVLSLPIYPELKLEEQSRITNSIKQFFA